MIQFDEHIFQMGLKPPIRFQHTSSTALSLSLSHYELEKATIITPYNFEKEGTITRLPWRKDT